MAQAVILALLLLLSGCAVRDVGQWIVRPNPDFRCPMC